MFLNSWQPCLLYGLFEMKSHCSQWWDGSAIRIAFAKLLNINRRSTSKKNCKFRNKEYCITTQWKNSYNP